VLDLNLKIKILIIDRKPLIIGVEIIDKIEEVGVDGNVGLIIEELIMNNPNTRK